MSETRTRRCQELVSHGGGTLVLGFVQGVRPPLAEKLDELGTEGGSMSTLPSPLLLL